MNTEFATVFTDKKVLFNAMSPISVKMVVNSVIYIGFRKKNNRIFATV